MWKEVEVKEEREKGEYCEGEGDRKEGSMSRGKKLLFVLYGRAVLK
jgi:hypothetical protein